MPCNHVQESRKPGRRTASARTIDVRSPLARKMVRLVVQFDLVLALKNDEQKKEVFLRIC